jgi:hypothetical protein
VVVVLFPDIPHSPVVIGPSIILAEFYSPGTVGYAPGVIPFAKICDAPEAIPLGMIRIQL